MTQKEHVSVCFVENAHPSFVFNGVLRAALIVNGSLVRASAVG